MIGKITNRKGFTLMELLIVIAILGILGVAFVPNILKAPAKARDAVRVKKVQDLHTAIEAYYAEHGSLPKIAAADADVYPGPCATDALATAVGMQSAPVDPNGLGSCGDGADAKGQYLYNVYKVGDEVHYVVAAKTEVPTSANTTLTTANLKAESQENNSVLLPVQSPANGTYFMATGPI